MNCEENGDGSASINNITQASRNLPSDRRCFPMAVFTACSNSHPFDERRIPILHGEEQSVKIGRAVVRFQPAANNAIFDCKVLSRNHAIMWYKDDRFYIKDTRSSNGTFINNERLSNSGEESAPHVLNSGDILQLGVEIVDNAKKVASGCVMCIVTLFNERGEECVGRVSSGVPANDSFLKVPLLNDHFSLKYTVVPNDKLFVMGQYMKEAKFREDMLGQKLHMLEEQLAKAQEALETSWHALINEEQLLSRIETLESQLMLVAGKNTSYKQISEEISQIQGDRTKAELFAKESLRKTEERIYETTMRMHTAKSRLIDLEEENIFLQEQSQAYHQELLKQRSEYEELLAKYNEANECIAEKVKTDVSAAATKNKSCDCANEDSERNIAASSTNGLDNNVTEEKWRIVEEEKVEREDGDELRDSSIVSDNEALRLRHGCSVAESDLNRHERGSSYDSGKRRHLRHSSDEQSVPNVSFIGEGQDRRCTCGRSLLQQPEKNCSSTDVQVLLMCTVPFVVVLAIIFLPLLNWMPVFSRTITSAIHHESNQQRPVIVSDNNLNEEMAVEEVDGEEQTREEGIE